MMYYSLLILQLATASGLVAAFGTAPRTRTLAPGAGRAHRPALASALYSAVTDGSSTKDSLQAWDTPPSWEPPAKISVGDFSTASPSWEPPAKILVGDFPTAPLADGAAARVSFAAFANAAARVLLDKRRLDELVALFTYSGTVHHDGRKAAGQGAVKRSLHTLLDGLVAISFEEVRAAPPAGSSGAVRVSALARLVLRDGDGEDASLADVALTFEPDGLVSHLEVTTREAAGAGAAPAAAVPPSPEDGPKWETDDGRVHQMIWRHQDIFAAGNPFLDTTLGLTTGRLIVIVDATVWALYRPKMEAWCASRGLTLDAIVAPGNENEKTMDNVLFMLDELARVDPLRRSEPVLAVGGGVLTDVAGFACALWRRGIPWARMPTTLLGMVDASVGIKVACNYKRKNGVGHFYSPLHSFIDPAFLPTVSPADIRSGVGEIMKAGLVHDARLFEMMEEHGEALVAANFVGPEGGPADRVIKFSVDTMLECIGPDLWEEALLRPMDFGHSFSRTLEADHRFFLRHGEAVAIDCVMSTMIAEVKGLVSAAEADRVLALYARLGLPCSASGLSAETYKRAAREITVHRDGLLRAPLPHGIGKCAFVDEMTDEEIDAAWARLQRFMDAHPATCWDRSWSFDAES